MIRIRNLAPLALAIVCSLWTVSPAQQQSFASRLAAIELPSKQGSIKVVYSQGYEARADQLMRSVGDEADFYAKKFGIKENVTLAVLSEEDWRKVALPVPYGVPNAQLPAIVFVAAKTDNATTAATLALKPKVSAATLKAIKDTGLSYEDAASKSVDLLSLHELGHLYSRAYGINTANKWLSEFLATYFAYAYLRDRDRKSADLFLTMSNVFTDAVEPKYTSLVDFERLYFGVGLDNYAWYQAAFSIQVGKVYNKKKLNFLTQVRDAFPISEKEPISLDTALKRLEKIQPGFTEWSHDLK